METSEIMIEQIIESVAGPISSDRQKYYLRESLRLLVRAAKSEQARDVNRCVALAIGVPAIAGTRRSKTVTRQFMASLVLGQGKLDFETDARE